MKAHHVPRDRAFLLTLLRGLYERGFRYFAAETLNPKDTGLQARGYPTLQTGYYTREPVFGDSCAHGTASRLHSCAL